MVFLTQDTIMAYESQCSGRCKAIVRRIAEQVRADTEQWSQMQELVAQVRQEMDELHASRDFWETRAYNADRDIELLRHNVEEWKEKALGYKKKVNKLQLELSVLKEKTDQKSKSSDALTPVPPPVKQLEKEKPVSGFRLKKNKEDGYKKAVGELNVEEDKERTPKKEVSLGKQLAKEKSMLVRRLKENRYPWDGRRSKVPHPTDVGVVTPNRSPLMDTGNLSPLTRQRKRSIFGFLSPESSRIRDSFIK